MHDLINKKMCYNSLDNLCSLEGKKMIRVHTQATNPLLGDDGIRGRTYITSLNFDDEKNLYKIV